MVRLLSFQKGGVCMEEKTKSRIIIDPKIMVGKPIIRGTRIPVDAIIKRLAEGMTIKEILEDYPNLTKYDVKAALQYTVDVIRGGGRDSFIVAKNRQTTCGF